MIYEQGIRVLKKKTKQMLQKSDDFNYNILI